MINIAVKLFEINGLQHTICSAKFILIVQMFALNVQSACRTSLPLPLTAIQMLYFTNKMLVYLDRSGPCCDRWKLMLVTAAARGHNQCPDLYNLLLLQNSRFITLLMIAQSRLLLSIGASLPMCQQVQMPMFAKILPFLSQIEFCPFLQDFDYFEMVAMTAMVANTPMLAPCPIIVQL